MALNQKLSQVINYIKRLLITGKIRKANMSTRIKAGEKAIKELKVLEIVLRVKLFLVNFGFGYYIG